MTVPETARTRLRDLAMRVAEIGSDPVQEENAEAWRSHNDLSRGRPMELAHWASRVSPLFSRGERLATRR